MTKKDKAFMQWKIHEYNKGRPREPEGDCDCGSDYVAGLLEMVDYAEDMLEFAFEAGWEACKEVIAEDL